MLTRFVNHIAIQQLFSPQQRGLLAVSGGIDSVVMTHLMHQAGYPFAIAHCNFHLRPGDCDRDEQFVRQLAQRYGVPIFVAQFDTHAYAQSEKLSIEEAARQLRYRYFEQLLEEQHLDYIATAHHRDDATETFFLNLLRGTGIGGLHGILSRNGHVVRPMLPFSRQQIEDYAWSESLAHVEDVTNSSLTYRRNQIRHQLMPLLRTINPAIDDIMQRNISHLSDAETLYRWAVDEQRRQSFVPQGDTLLLRHADVAGLHPQRTLLYEFLSPFGFNASVVDDVLQLQGDTQYGQQFSSATHRLTRKAEGLLIEPIGEGQQQEESVSIDRRSVEGNEAMVEYGDERIVFRVCPCEQIDSLKMPANQALFDTDRLSWPLHLRPWRDADRIVPYGMKGTQLVSDLFTHHHLTSRQKTETPMLCDAQGNILWVVGLRASRLAAVSSDTKTILSITVHRKHD